MTDWRLTAADLPWHEGMDYGWGVNILTGEVAGLAVDPGGIASVTNANGQRGLYNVTLVRTMEELYSSIGINIQAGARFTFFRGGSKFDYTDRVKFKTESTYVVASSVIENAFLHCVAPKLLPEVAKLIRKDGPDTSREALRARCGDGFVRGIKTGGEFYAVIEIMSASREEQENISVSLQAQLSGICASGNVKTQIDTSNITRSEQTKIHIFTYQSAGLKEQIGFTENINEMLNRLRQFSTYASEHPVPYAVQVAGYTTLDLPEQPDLIDLQYKQDILDDCAHKRLTLMTLRNNIDLVIERPELFINPPSRETLQRWSRFFADELMQLAQRASSAAHSVTITSAPFTLSYPHDFAMPARLANSRHAFTCRAADVSRMDGVMVLRSLNQPLAGGYGIDVLLDAHDDQLHNVPPSGPIKFAEWIVANVASGSYNVKCKYASAELRKLDIFIGDQLALPGAFAAPTGGWGPNSRMEFPQGRVTLQDGDAVIRISCPASQSFPHVESMTFTPIQGR